MRITTAAIVVRDDKVLLVRRSVGAIAGLWEFPGGKVDEGETPEEGLVRELREELGVGAEVGRELARSSFRNRGRDFELRAYRVELASTDIELVDHDALQWVDPVRLGEERLAESDRGLLPALEHALKGEGN